MAAVLYTPHFIQFLDNSGNPLSGGKLYTYSAGTTTPKAAYTTAAATVPTANPIVLDSQGRASFFIDGSYKFLLTDANDVPIGPNGGVTDNVTSFSALDSATDAYFESFSGNGTQTVFTTSQDLGAEEKALFVWVDSGLQEHSTNGSFATDTAWTKGTGWTIGSGVATAAGAISTAISQTSAVTLLAGQAYNITYTVTRSAGGLIPSVGGQNGAEVTASGTYKITVVSGSTQTIAFTGNGFTGTLDNVSITPAVSKGYQILNPSQFTINGTSLTFSTAPAVGTGNILVSAPLLQIGAASSAALAAQTAQAGAETAQAAAEAAAQRVTGTSTTSNLIGTGSKSFTTQSGKFFDVGNWLIISSAATPSNYMHGQVTEYSGTSLTVNVTNVGGSGTLADWNISLSGTQGAKGDTGDINASTAANTLLGNITSSTAPVTANALSANQFLARSSTGDIAAKTITDFGLSLVDDADAATARTTLGVGMTLIASGNLATGSPTLVDITSIPQTYTDLVLVILGASNSVNTRGLYIDVSDGVNALSAQSGSNNKGTWHQIATVSGTTTVSINSSGGGAGGSLWTVAPGGISEALYGIIRFPGYSKSGLVKTAKSFVDALNATGTGFQSSTHRIISESVLLNSTTPKTAGITGIRITWDVVSTGVFDAGTYELYGVA